MLRRLIRRVKGWIVEDGPPHNHPEGGWRFDCQALSCKPITEEYARDVEAWIRLHTR